MRENKRPRQDEMNGTSPVEEESTYPNESASLSMKQEPDAELLTHNQHIIVNQSEIQSQQLVYQVQKLCDQDQNFVYFLVPTNENLQLPLPVSILPNQHASEAPTCYINGLPEEQICRDPLKQETDLQGDQHKENHSYSLTNNPDQTYCSNVKSKTSALKPMVYHCDFPECLEFFHSLYDKKIHLDSHIFPENTEFKCGICDMKFSRAVDRNKHIESHAIAPTHKCKDCQRDFSYFTVLIKHLREKKCSTKSPITCYFCKIKLTDFDDLIRHHQMTMKQCVCGMKRCGTQLFEMHVALCNAVKPFEAVTCERKRMKVERGVKKVH